MGNMKIFLVLLLCMFVSREWNSCEASRKMFIEGGEEDGAGGLFFVSRRILSEGGEETNDMETELMLPDDSDRETLAEEVMGAEEKHVKQQKEPLIDAVDEERSEKKKKKQHKENGSIFLKTGDGELLLEKSEEGTFREENTTKKKEYLVGEMAEAEAFVEQETEGRLTREKGQEKAKKGMKAKRNTKRDTEESSSSSQTSEEDGSFIMESGEEAEGFTGEASLADAVMEVETGVGSFLSEVGEEDEGNTFKEKLRVKQKKGRKEKVEGSGKAKKEEKADVDKVFKSSALDGKAFKGLPKAEEIADVDTAVDVIEREMEGGAVDLVAKAVDEDKGGDFVEGKHKPKGKVGMKQHGSSDVSTQSDFDEAKKKSSKKTKTSKKSKTEAATLEENDTELKELTSSDGKGGVEMRRKKKKDKLSELERDSNVFAGEMLDTKADKSSDLQLKQTETLDMVKSKTQKKKKMKSSEKSKKEEELSVKKDERSSEKAEKKETQSVKKETEAGTEDSKTSEVKKGEEMAIFEVGDVNAKAEDEDDTRKQKQSEVVDGNAKTGHEDDSKRSEVEVQQPEDELSTIEKQEEKLEVEVQGIAKDARERAEGSISMTKSVSSSSQGVDEEDDEYGDFMQDFSDVSTNFQDTALKVADHIGPNIQKLTDTSKNYFNKANQQITESFSPLVGKQFAPFFASVISYGLLLVPLAVVILLFEHIRALLSLQKVLLFVNIYLAAYFASLLLATFIIGEPMNFFYKSSASGYIHLQLLQGLGYIIYLILQTFDLVSACSSSETLPAKVTVVLQWFVAFTIGFHYYVTIFHRAMALKGPHTSWKIYGIYSIAFSVLCLFARIKRVKKGYTQLGQVDADADTDKKH